MNRCQPFLNLISRSLDEALTQDECQQLHLHQQFCPACRAIAEDMALLHESMQSLDDVIVPEALLTGVMDQIQAETAQKAAAQRKKLKKPALMQMFGLAACAVLCVGVFQVMKGMPKGAGSSQAMPAASASVEGTSARQIAPQMSPNLLEPQEATTYTDDVGPTSDGIGPQSTLPQDGAPMSIAPTAGDEITPFAATAPPPETFLGSSSLESVDYRTMVWKLLDDQPAKVLILSGYPSDPMLQLPPVEQWLTLENGMLCCAVEPEVFNAVFVAQGSIADNYFEYAQQGPHALLLWPS